MLSELKETLSGKKTEQLALEIAETKKLQDSHSQLLASLKDDLTSATSKIKIMMQQQGQMTQESEKAIETIGELKSQLGESINSVKILSSTIQNTLTRKITDEISTLTQEVSSKLSGSEKVKKEVEEAATSVKTELQNLSEEIKRLKSVSANIKAQDFELGKFASQLQAADSEKLRLMRQIDSLQRLVSALRRQR